MKVLITGMTSTQVNPISHLRSPNFVGLMVQQFVDFGVQVDWKEPSVGWDDAWLKRYDSVIVGVSPLTGMGANRAYGALNVLERMWDDPRLRLVVDAPDPLKMESANQAIVDHPKNLTKDFFSYRKEYSKVLSDSELRARLIQAADHLCNDPWPTTIVPQLPWQTEQQFRVQLPKAPRLHLMNLDHLLLEAFPARGLERHKVWSREPGSHPSWGRRSDVTWPVHHLPRNHRKDVTSDVITQLAQSSGCLIDPSKTGTWWSSRYAMALSQRTPICTDWHESQFLSSAWVHLPSSIEHMSDEKRELVADEQYASYAAAVPTPKEMTYG